jgi:DNA helicase-2/ATP-dependent DNA helicase PcrA
MTRAKRTLALSRAVYRRSWANADLAAAAPSRFLAEVPADLVEAAHGSLAEPGETRRYEPDPDYYESQFRRSKKPAAHPVSRPAAASASNGAANRLIGARVRHPTYGIGTILKIEDDGDDRRLTVSFRDYGTKKLIERYAHLQIV